MSLAIGLGLIILFFIHTYLFSFLDLGTNLLLFISHLFYIICGIIYFKRLKNFSLLNYLLGYFLLFLFLFSFFQRYLIFILSLFLYSALFHLPHKKGYLFIFLFSIIVVTAYWLVSFIILSLFYALILEFIKRKENIFYSYLLGTGFILLILVLSPLLYILFQATPQTILSVIKPEFKEAFLNSLFTALLSTLIISVFGVPLGYCLARKEFKIKPFLDALIDLPILVPQTAAGIAILVFLGPKTPIGSFFYRYLGINFSGSLLGIIACQIFVSTPFLVRSAQSSFADINPKLENMSRILGASPRKTFFKVSLPLALPGIFNGCILSFCRSLSEAGSLMIVAYRPFTIPIYTHDIFLRYGIEEAIPVTILFLIIFLWIFIVLKWSYELRKKRIYSL